MNTTEIHALLQLLLDEDAAIRDRVADRFRQLGADGIVALESAEASDDARLRVRARALRARLRSDDVAAGLSQILLRPDPDLEEAVIHLARTEHPEVDPSSLRTELERLARLLQARLATCATPRARALALGRLIHGEEGFRGNAEHYYDPRNSYLDQVLRRRLGIPISLAAIYILVGRRAGLRLRGVGMPMHFLVQLQEGDDTILLDPYGAGRILTKEACRALLAGFNHSFREDYLRPVSDRDMLRRMFANLVHIYNDREDRVRLARLYSFVNALQGRKA